MRGRWNLNLMAWMVVSAAASLVLAATVISAANAQDVTIRQEQGFCRPSDPQQELARNPWSRARQMLAPRGARSISLCRYASGRTGDNSLKLEGNDEVTNRTTKRQLISKFDALKQYHGPPLHCPGDTGSEVLASLFYRRHEVKIIVRLSGCPIATNGDLSRAAFNFDGKNPDGPRLLDQLEHLTQHRQFQGA